MPDSYQTELRLIFHSIHNVMLAEELLLKMGIPIDMIPVPREISSDCGMCLACHHKDLNRIKAGLEQEPFTSSIMIYERKKVNDSNNSEFTLLLTLE